MIGHQSLVGHLYNYVNYVHKSQHSIKLLYMTDNVKTLPAVEPWPDFRRLWLAIMVADR